MLPLPYWYELRLWRLVKGWTFRGSNPSGREIFRACQDQAWGAHLAPCNPLTPNDPYRGRTAPLTSKVAFYISLQQIYVLNILNMVYNLRFF